MKVKFIYSLLIGLVICGEAYAQFPYNQTFKDNQAPNMVFGGNPTSASLTFDGSNPANGGSLRLTNADNDQTGYAYNNSILPTIYGMDVSFEYFMYGGSGADGITFFLFDGSTPEFRIGEFGGALGYAQRCEGPGVSNAYVGIGFDAFGNFSGEKECRLGTELGGGSVVVRGPGNGNTPQEYLQIAGVNTNTIAQPFPLTEGNSKATDPSMPGYRKAFITFRPQGLGARIVVSIQHGSIITEVLTAIISTPPPANLKFGFTASTGSSTNFHEIENLSITIPKDIVIIKPLAVSDIVPNVCSNASVNFNIMANDVAVNPGAILLANSIDLDTIAPGIQNTVTIPQVGRVSVSATGDLSFVPVSTFASTYAIGYKIGDSFRSVSNGASITLTGKLAPTISSNMTKSIYSGLSVDLTLTTTGTAPSNSIYTYPTPVATGGTTGGIARPVATDLKITDILTNPTNAPQTVVYSVTPQSNECVGNAGLIIITVNPRPPNTAPVLIDDSVSTKQETIVTIAPLLNDRDPDGTLVVTTLVITEPKHGTVVVDAATGVLQYTPLDGYFGIDSIYYTVCDNGIFPRCETALIKINVIQNPFFIPEGFSPNNGDDINQKFVIGGTEKLKVSLSIFNRWGDKVYEAEEYKNDWEGTSNKGLKIGQSLPDGTYFITVDLNNGQTIPKYITISR